VSRVGVKAWVEKASHFILYPSIYPRLGGKKNIISEKQGDSVV